MTMRADPLIMYRAAVLRLYDLWREANDESHLPTTIDLDAVDSFAREVERAENIIRAALASVRVRVHSRCR